MVELALPRQLHEVGQRAIGEAQARRAGVVEAEHLLLAILARPREPAAAASASAGLDYPTFAQALDAERARSLGVAGILAPRASALSATPRPTIPGWGASVRDVLRGADKAAAKDGRAGALEIELTLSILAADLGTVPRALSIVGLDRANLIDVLTGAR